MKHLYILALFLLLLAARPTSVHAQAAPVPDAAIAASAPEAATGYLGMVELGFLYGKIENPFNNPTTYMATPTVQIYNGYRAHRLFAIGATIGFDFYENILITPLALGIRGELLGTRVSPFYSLDAGYGSAFLSSESSGINPEGGWFFNPALGIQVKTGYNTAYTFGLGYKQQRIETEFKNWGIQTNQKITYKRLSLRMGFMF